MSAHLYLDLDEMDVIADALEVAAHSAVQSAKGWTDRADAGSVITAAQHLTRIVALQQTVADSIAKENP